MVKVSVIMPVYNVENYLRECLDSITNQTLNDLEIICVNDGSTDNSPEILKEYGEKDKRITIITQSNQGLGAARNNGLKHAAGEYIYFIDSDDYLNHDALQKLYDNAVLNDSDMVLFKFQTVDDFKNVHKRKVEFRINEDFENEDFNTLSFTYKDVKRHVLNSAFSACLKLYRSDLIKGFPFPEGINFEDVPVHVKVMLNAERLSFVNEHLYNYRSNPDSILNATLNSFDIFTNIDMVESYLKDNGYYTELENEFIFFKIAQILIYLIPERSEDYFIKAKEEFNKLTIKNESTLKNYALTGYRLVLSSDSYIDYVIASYEDKISALKKQNRKLKSEISKQKDEGLMKSLRSFRKK